MGFFWQCPGCKTKYFYRGSKTTEAVTTCTPCKLKLRIFQYKIVVKPTDDGNKTTPKPQKLELNGMVGDLIIALSWAINTIKNKPEVKNKVKFSTYFQYFERWSRYRLYFQDLEEEKR